MGLNTAPTIRQKNQDPRLEALINAYHSLENTDEFPLDMAIASIDILQGEAKSSEELLQYLLEDIIFTSLYATYYEYLFTTIQENTNLTLALVEAFEKDKDDRDLMIAKQTEEHLNYVQNGGHCDGCISCEHHVDVDDLLTYWTNKDLDFFFNLYIGMQNIQATMEYILYDLLPEKTELAIALRPQVITNFRKYLFDYSEKALT